jgi:hypothetical protein
MFVCSKRSFFLADDPIEPSRCNAHFDCLVRSGSALTLWLFFLRFCIMRWELTSILFVPAECYKSSEAQSIVHLAEP